MNQQNFDTEQFKLFQWWLFCFVFFGYVRDTFSYVMVILCGGIQNILD